MEQVRCTLAPWRPTAIILYGGYGRGEGSWIEDADAPYGWRPYNDYDLLVIGGRRIPRTDLCSLKTNLADSFGLRWVDLTQKRRWQLRMLPPRIYTHDLKVASKVVYGSAEVLDVVPEVDASALSLREAETLFLTRLWTVTGGVSEEELNAGTVGEQSRFFRNQMAKAVLAAGDMILLRHGAYHASYRERACRLSRMNTLTLGERAKKLLAWAVQEKLRPTAVDMPASAVEEMYTQVLSFFLEQSFASIGALYQIDAQVIFDLRRAFYRDPWHLVKRAFRMVRLGSTHYEWYLRAVWAQAHVAASKDKRRSDSQDLWAANDLLRRCGVTITDTNDWDALRKEASRLRMLFG